MPWDARPDPAGRAAATALATGAAAAARPKGQLNAHVPALDGVRGCAVLLVVVYHFANSFYVLGFTNPIVSAARIGWLGVDVFFALSGFLITGILLDTKSSANYFGSFYARRFLRIFPLYYGAIILVL
ncbi:MAG: acyltransferase 3, partial [Phenylobacterium sp.]|nr:acyltransferase 3 [Phenylobacterium sp.]